MSKRRTDEKHDQATQDSFPASDPPASTGITGPRVDDPQRAKSGSKDDPAEPASRSEDARPKGSPTTERHATETAYQPENAKRPQRSR
jgi:hypothetical protein